MYPGLIWVVSNESYWILQLYPPEIPSGQLQPMCTLQHKFAQHQLHRPRDERWIGLEMSWIDMIMTWWMDGREKIVKSLTCQGCMMRTYETTCGLFGGVDNLRSNKLKLFFSPAAAQWDWTGLQYPQRAKFCTHKALAGWPWKSCNAQSLEDVIMISSWIHIFHGRFGFFAWTRDPQRKSMNWPVPPATWAR